MLGEYSHTKSESLVQIRTTMAEIQHFCQGIVFYWRTLYIRFKQLFYSDTLSSSEVYGLWVIPAPKINPPTSIQNDLRPISLLPTLAKVLEKLVGRWLLPYLERNFDNNQFGCRRDRLTTCLLYTSPSPRDRTRSRMPSSA